MTCIRVNRPACRSRRSTGSCPAAATVPLFWMSRERLWRQRKELRFRRDFARHVGGRDSPLLERIEGHPGDSVLTVNAGRIPQPTRRIRDALHVKLVPDSAANRSRVEVRLSWWVLDRYGAGSPLRVQPAPVRWPMYFRSGWIRIATPGSIRPSAGHSTSPNLLCFSTF